MSSSEGDENNIGRGSTSRSGKGRTTKDTALMPSDSSSASLQSWGSDVEPEGGIDARAGVPSSFGGARSRGRRKKRQRTQSPSFDTDSVSGSVSAKSAAGAWEAHTLGYGSRMLAKMGFDGVALGAKGRQGISAPVLPGRVPQGKMGLGAGMSSGNGKREKEEIVKGKKDVEKGRERVERKWKKRNEGSEKVVDMRPPQSALMKERLPQMDAVHALRHNVLLLQDTSRAEMERTERKLETERNIVLNSQRELERLRKNLADAEREEDELKKLYMAVRKLKTKDDEKLADAINGFRKIQISCKDSDAHGVRAALLAVAAPASRREFERALDVASVEASKKHADIAKDILDATRHALCTGPKRLGDDKDETIGLATEEYLRLCCRCVLVPLTLRFREQDWDVTSERAFRAADVLAVVKACVHPRIVQRFADNSLVPALCRAIKRTRNGISDMHGFTHPWLPAVGTAGLQGAFEDFTMALRKNVRGKNAATALHVLEHWHGVLPKKVVANVARDCLKNAGDNESENERLDAQMWTQWTRLVGSRNVGRVLRERAVGTLKLLRDRLFAQAQGRGQSSSADVLKHAVSVYEQWQKLPGNVLSLLRAELAGMLFMISACTHVHVAQDGALGTELAQADVTVLLRNAYGDGGEQVFVKKSRAKTKTKATMQSTTGTRASLKDTVDAIAAQHGLALVSEGRDADGRAIYALGNVHVVLDAKRNIVLCKRPSDLHNDLKPVRLSELLELALADFSGG